MLYNSIIKERRVLLIEGYMKFCDENKLEKLSDFIKTYQSEYGKSPSYRDIMKVLDFSSLSMVHRYVDILQERKIISRNECGGIDISRNLRLGQTILAPVVGVVTCGSPIYAQENIEGTYQLPTEIFGNGKTFILHAEGDSMIDAGINNGDLLVVKQCDDAIDGDIVVALLEDSATVKRFYRKKDHVVLHPENPCYDDIVTKDVKILGKVSFCIHEL